MMQSKRKGFTLIELLIVVVIIGILAAVAIPKFAATKDKAKLAAVKTDVRNAMGTMEGLASDSGKYVTPGSGGTDEIIWTVGNEGDQPVANTAGNGYTVEVTNGSITTGQNTCTVTVGADATTPETDGVIVCTEA